jgi:hypothetical protein
VSIWSFVTTQWKRLIAWGVISLIVLKGLLTVWVQVSSDWLYPPASDQAPIHLAQWVNLVSEVLNLAVQWVSGPVLALGVVGALAVRWCEPTRPTPSTEQIN